MFTLFERELPETMADVIHSLTPGEQIDVWAKEAGFDWDIETRDVFIPNGKPNSYQKFPRMKALVRSDDGRPLSMVSSSYKPVQPKTILEFFQKLVASGGYELSCAGTMYYGRRMWAMAKTNHHLNVGTKKNPDNLNGFLLVHGSCDRMMSTQVMFTSYRMSCTNQMPLILRQAREKGTPKISIPHSRLFDPDQVTADLGLLDRSWTEFGELAKSLSNRTVTDEQATEFFTNVLYPREEDREKLNVEKAGTTLQRALEVYEYGDGQELPTAHGTAWGLVNAVTNLMDHETRARSNEARLDNAWFRNGSRTKTRAWDLALEMIN